MDAASQRMYRTLLFAPGARPELLAKAQAGQADAMIFDLEDSVAPQAKAQAREHIAAALAAGLRKPMYLRINHPNTDEFRRDLAVLSDAGSLDGVAGVILPKAEEAADVDTVAEALLAVEGHASLPMNTLAIVPLVETCLGLRNAYDMARASPRVRGMALASAEQGDFMVDLGGRWTPSGLALAYARGKLVVDARAAGIEWLVDGVFMNLASADALRAECEIAREQGFVGKMAIHPSQIEVMHAVFSPGEQEIEYARGLLAAFRESEAAGIAAVKYQGMMVDYANVRLAQRTLSLAREQA
ncbi:HpcH/HpaI aldolase/citrate lyase family protein [Bordetella genomosp. 13]|uniref:HpcH/HpaI aldolase/citrate lyase family protein n=1 Tax=Bordetella genomosp. 13 TaxID=463040 RepID=UPI0011A8F65D|nr:CoA ester lyase [Bordetella genomosp. 13]